MRPIKLTMTAFGPFADTQVIDFRQLNERAFFLIHGPTGAGKTTILDAICFALYGETSGNERKGEQMRSHHAKTTTLTEVTFDFALGDETYRVARTLKRERSENSDVEISYKPDKATLWRRTGIEEEHVPGSVLASKSSKVTDAIVGLFGFESSQFRQVIVLPQDKFQKLLMANSQDREKLFRTLFQTEQYEKIEKAFRDEAKDLADELKRLRDDRKLILSLANVSTLDELNEIRQEVESELEAKKIELALHRLEEQLASDEYTQGQETQRNIDEYKQSEIELQKLQSKQVEFTTKRQQLARAQRASELTDLENSTEHQRQEAANLQKRQAEAQGQLVVYQKKQQQAVDTLDQELKRDPERDDARRKRDVLAALQVQVNELETARHELDIAKGQADQAFHDRNVSQASREKVQKELTRVEQELGQIESVKLKLSAAQQAEAEAEKVHQQVLKLRDIERKLKTAQNKEAEARDRLTQVETNLGLAREKTKDMQDAWLNGQAAFIASQLKENSPCPVCGSTSHPQPAFSDQPLPSESDLKSAQSSFNELERQYQDLQIEWTLIHDETVRLDSERKPLAELLGDKANLSVEEIQFEHRSAQSHRKSVEEDDRRLVNLVDKLEPLKASLARAEADFTIKDKIYLDASSSHTSSQAVFLERERNIPPELNDLEKLKVAQNQAIERVNQLETALQNARTKASKAIEQAARAETTLKEITEQAKKEKQRAEEMDKQFLQRVKDGSFSDLDDYCSAKLKPTEINVLDTAIREYERQLHAARERFERAFRAAESLSKPDLEKLKGDCDQARKKVEETLRSIQSLENLGKSYKEQLGKLTQVQEEFDRVEKQYSTIGKLSDVVNGKNAYNLTFQRFVLSSLLDDVLSDATFRLNTMSRGRYILQRTQSPQDKRKASGLDLVISDTWTGDSKRPVETLSGGEGFYTSLALALGLAEVVQRYAGGIRLDTIFVDEGFGSLDTDTLDLAIRTLESLKEGGRIVGIISHVESMRERIPARVEVIAGVTGSSVKLKNG